MNDEEATVYKEETEVEEETEVAEGSIEEQVRVILYASGTVWVLGSFDS
jgi:hypothetical protein